jgi:hypothetical protein
MTDGAIRLPDTRHEEEARRNECMHRVYSYLLQLAARKEAAARGTVGTQTRATAGEAPIAEPNSQERV